MPDFTPEQKAFLGMDNREIEKMLYVSLIVAAAILLGTMLMAAADSYGFNVLGLAILLVFPAGMVIVVTLLFHVVTLFKCSWSARGHLLIWYACLFVGVLALESLQPRDELPNFPEMSSTSGVALSDLISIIALGVGLIILPVTWLRKFLRS